jgi:L-xylulose reductase
LAAPSLGIYDTTKAALDMLTKSMAVELGKHNIRVNSVNPNMFETDMTKNWLKNNPGGGEKYQERTPLKRLVDSSEIVNTILFLMSDFASMVNATTVLIDGGYTAN